jgi:GNAT superfamily N-acetyltransferase
VSFGIQLAREDDLADLLPLMRGYCDFYEASPADERLLWLARELIADPERAGVQLIARASDDARALGFATVYWSFQTLRAARAAVMNDLFVVPEARGTGLAEALIAACADAARTHGAPTLGWQTAMTNLRAQAVYDRVGAKRSQWLDYTLTV